MASPPQASLLWLPTEIRLQIYDHFFTPITPREDHELPRSTFNDLATRPNISRVCRTLHRETRSILFARHTFVFARDLTKRPLASPPWPEIYSTVTSLLIPTHADLAFPFPNIKYDFKPHTPRPTSPALYPYASTYTYGFMDIYTVMQCLPALRRVYAMNHQPVNMGHLDRRLKAMPGYLEWSLSRSKGRLREAETLCPVDASCWAWSVYVRSNRAVGEVLEIGREVHIVLCVLDEFVVGVSDEVSYDSLGP